MKRALFATILFFLSAHGAWAQGYPARSVRIVVPFAPGGGADVIARLVAQRLTETWGQSMELLKTMTGIKAVHVPFKGAGPGTIALTAGEVHMQFASVLPLMGLIQSGRLKSLAISGPKRSPALPDVPTVAESVPGYEAVTWYGLLAPAGTPAPVITRIHADVVKIAVSAEFQDRMVKDGGTVTASTPSEFADYLKADIVKRARVVKAIGAQLD